MATGRTAPTATSGVSLPLVTSPNVRVVDSFPETLGISGEFARTGPFLLCVEPRQHQRLRHERSAAPEAARHLDNLVFENEAMSYGERIEGGELRRFVLVGNDLYNATVDPRPAPQRGRLGGGEVIVVDVTDPSTRACARARRRSRTRRGDDQYDTVQCLTTACEYAYTAGDSGPLGVDLRDLDQPAPGAAPSSTASTPNAIFTTGAGHYWDFDATGVGWHTGSAARPRSTSRTRWTRGPQRHERPAARRRPRTTSSTTTRSVRTPAASGGPWRRASPTATCCS